MINFTEYNTRSFKITAHERNGTRWLHIEANGNEFLFFFDLAIEFDDALRVCQGLAAPEPTEIELPQDEEIDQQEAHYGSSRDLDDEVPF